MERKIVISSLAFKFVESFAVKGIGLFVSIILARLISPEDFGQIAIIMVFINLANTFINSGLNSALVQKKNINDADYSTVFYISTLISIILIAVLYISAPIIAKFYNSNALILPLRVYSVVLVLGAFNSVQIAKLQREMKFKVMMYCNLTATIISGLLGVAAAFYGLGIWALVIYYFSHTLVASFVMLFVANWLPKLTFSIRSAKSLFSYGWKLLVSSLLCSLYNDIRSLIIGKKFSSEALGFYNRGQQFPNIISTTADTSIQSVMFPTLSSAQDDKEQMKNMLRRSMLTGAFIIFPAMAGMASVSESLVRILFGNQWLESVIYMQILCIAEAHLPISSSNLIVVKAMGRSDWYMKFEIIRRISMLIVLFISVFCFNSVEAIAIGYAVSSWLDVVIVTIPMKKIIGYGFIEQLRDLWKMILASVTMVIVVLLIGKISIPIIFLLFLQVVIGIITYIGMCVLLKVETFNYVFSLLKNILTNKNK